MTLESASAVPPAPAAEEDDFAATFEALANEVLPAPADTPPVDPPPADTPPADTPPADTPPADTPPADTPPADTPPADTPPAENEWQARIAALEAQIAAAQTPPPAAPPPVVAEKPLYTVEEEAVLGKYREDWPEVAAAEELVRRKEYRQLIEYVFDQVRQRYDPALEYVDTRAPQDQYSAIVGLVQDYDKVRDPTLAWIETQPAYLKAAYQNVATNGSAVEVADLIARFKKETNYVAPAGTPAPAAAPPQGMTPPAAPVTLPEKAKQAAAALRVVSSKRTEQSSSTDPNDFDGAFAEFARATK